MSAGPRIRRMRVAALALGSLLAAVALTAAERNVVFRVEGMT